MANKNSKLVDDAIKILVSNALTLLKRNKNLNYNQKPYLNVFEFFIDN